MSDSSRPVYRAYLVLGLGIVGLGFSGIFVSWADAPGAVTGFYRMIIALTFLAPPFVRRLRRRTKIPQAELRIALLAGLFFAGDLILWNSGILISGATNPTLLGNTAPIWVGIGALVFFREKLSQRFWLGLMVALAGAFVILGLDTLDSVGLGSLFGLLAGVFYAAYYLVIQRSRQQLDALTSFWLSGASATVALLAAALLLKQPVTGYTAVTYLNFLGLGLVVQVGGQLAVNYALGYLPASVVSPTNLGQPVITALLAIPLLNETLSFWQVLGGVAVIAGVLIVHLSRIGTKAKQSAPSTPGMD